MKINKTLCSIFGLAIISLTFFAFTSSKQDAGNIRNVSGFSGIGVGGHFKVFVKIGNEESLRIEADNEALSEIITEVKDNTLYIKTKKDNWKFWNNYKKEVIVYVTAKKLKNLAVSGSGSLKVEDELKSDEINLAVSGSGNMSLSLSAKEVSSAISGSGSINVTGSASESSISVSGSGNFDGLDLKTNKTSVVVSGSGKASVYSDTEISSIISGSGSVNYKGNAQTTNSKTSGSGKIKKIG